MEGKLGLGTCYAYAEVAAVLATSLLVISVSTLRALIIYATCSRAWRSTHPSCAR
jgi:hypothetical protein